MTTLAKEAVEYETLGDLLARLGDIPPERVLLRPVPGTATEADVLDVHARTNRLCELVDGTLVEKGMGYVESVLAVAIAAALREFVVRRNLGLVSGESGMMRLFAGLVRIPDVAYTSWDRIPGRKVPAAPIPGLVPDLAVEVLSKSNTQREMQRKLGEYFQAGVRLVWIIDPETRTVAVHTSPDRPTILDASGTLDGGDVLPGFALPLRDVFAELDRHANP